MGKKSKFKSSLDMSEVTPKRSLFTNPVVLIITLIVVIVVVAIR